MGVNKIIFNLSKLVFCCDSYTSDFASEGHNDYLVIA